MFLILSDKAMISKSTAQQPTETKILPTKKTLEVRTFQNPIPRYPY